MEESEFYQPDWNAGGKTHNWRNYVGEEVKRQWPYFDVKQKRALAENFQEIADREEWD